ncbi:MAG: hypothetical protein KDK37_12990 [Leptospiraceae bacterium]|nr:hypothetical protein [Leptospiraceae bacterium]MCB1305196.1 hypothetical protein [Leptospiraceae bacterium]
MNLSFRTNSLLLRTGTLALLLGMGSQIPAAPEKKAPGKSGCSTSSLDPSRISEAEFRKTNIQPKTIFCLEGKEITASALEKEQKALRSSDEKFLKSQQSNASKNLKDRKNRITRDTKAWKPNKTNQTIIAALKRSKIQDQSGIPGLIKAESSSNAPASESSAAGPSIQFLNASSGGPGDPIVITGQRFGSSRGKVLLQVSADRSVEAIVKEWNDTYVVAQVPDLSGLIAFAGWVQIKNSAGVSSPAAFAFEPALDVQRIPVTGKIHDPDPNTNFPGWFTCADEDLGNAAFHDGATFITGCSEQDTFLGDLTNLKNGWVVDHVVFVKNLRGDAECTIHGPADGSANASFYIDWRVGPRGGVSYYLEVYLRGPRGTNYR